MTDARGWLTRELVGRMLYYSESAAGAPRCEMVLDAYEAAALCRMSLAALDMTTLDAMKARHPLISLDAPVADEGDVRGALVRLLELCRAKFHVHESGCDNDGMDTCQCGYSEISTAMRKAKAALHATPATAQTGSECECKGTGRIKVMEGPCSPMEYHTKACPIHSKQDAGGKP